MTHIEQTVSCNITHIMPPGRIGERLRVHACYIPGISFSTVSLQQSASLPEVHVHRLCLGICLVWLIQYAARFGCAETDCRHEPGGNYFGGFRWPSVFTGPEYFTTALPSSIKPTIHVMRFRAYSTLSPPPNCCTSHMKTICSQPAPVTCIA